MARWGSMVVNLSRKWIRCIVVLRYTHGKFPKVNHQWSRNWIPALWDLPTFEVASVKLAKSEIWDLYWECLHKHTYLMSSICLMMVYRLGLWEGLAAFWMRNYRGSDVSLQVGGRLDIQVRVIYYSPNYLPHLLGYQNPSLIAKLLFPTIKIQAKSKQNPNLVVSSNNTVIVDGVLITEIG